MKTVSGRVVWLLAATAAASLDAGGALAQDHPGQIPDVSTYRGSIEQQNRDAESARQNAPQPQPGYTPPRSSSGGGPSGPARPAAPEIDWAKRPPLAAARNPLLGHWQPTKVDTAKAARDSHIGEGEVFGELIPGLVAAIAQDSFQEDCDRMFGNRAVEFTAAGMVAQGRDGRPMIAPLAYRADGNDVIVLRREQGQLEVFRVRFEGHDRITSFPPGCPMSRTGGGATAALTAGTTGAAARPAPPAVATNSTLEFNVGFAERNRFVPIAGVTVYVVPSDPDAALAKAGLGPMESWLRACKTNAQVCNAGFQAMTAGAVGNVHTDAAGKATLPALPQGRYFLVGKTDYQGQALVWHRPITIQPGANGAFMDQTTATAG